MLYDFKGAYRRLAFHYQSVEIAILTGNKRITKWLRQVPPFLNTWQRNFVPSILRLDPACSKARVGKQTQSSSTIVLDKSVRPPFAIAFLQFGPTGAAVFLAELKLAFSVQLAPAIWFPKELATEMMKDIISQYPSLRTFIHGEKLYWRYILIASIRPMISTVNRNFRFKFLGKNPPSADHIHS